MLTGRVKLRSHGRHIHTQHDLKEPSKEQALWTTYSDAHSIQSRSSCLDV